MGREPLHLLMAAAEMAPFAKVGGLGDVIGSLPIALAARGHRVRVLIPDYRDFRFPKGVSLQPRPGFPVREIPFGNRLLRVTYRSFAYRGVEVVPVDVPECFGDRSGIYGGEDRGGTTDFLRFTAFCRAVSAFVRMLPDVPDVVHLHDSHAALTAAMLREETPEGDSVPVPVLLTLHNLAFQGDAPMEEAPATGLPSRCFESMGSCEFHGRINPLKGGIVYANGVTTVSPTYAREILDPEFGCGLEGVLVEHGAKLEGILNGIDTETWNPAGDRFLSSTYGITDGPGRIRTARAGNAASIRRELGLEPGEGTLAVFVGRLTHQKGIDLLADAAGSIVADGVQLAVLGTGQAIYEEGLRGIAGRFPGRVAVRIGYDEGLAHRLFAAGTMLLVPSRYEPCGLTQMYGMRYGAVPVARATGGLADTVVDVGANPERGCGFLFDEPTAGGLVGAVRRARDLLADADRRAVLVRRGMVRDFSWDRSGEAYERIFRRLAGRARKLRGSTAASGVAAGSASRS